MGSTVFYFDFDKLNFYNKVKCKNKYIFVGERGKHVLLTDVGIKLNMHFIFNYEMIILK